MDGNDGGSGAHVTGLGRCASHVLCHQRKHCSMTWYYLSIDMSQLLTKHGYHANLTFMFKPKLRVREASRPKSAWAERVRRSTTHGQELQTVYEVWVEAAVNDQWMAAYRLVPGQHREPVIAELRIFPRERMNGRPPGRWSAAVLGIEANVPEGGISADLVRRVRI